MNIAGPWAYNEPQEEKANVEKPKFKKAKKWALTQKAEKFSPSAKARSSMKSELKAQNWAQT